MFYSSRAGATGGPNLESVCFNTDKLWTDFLRYVRISLNLEREIQCVFPARPQGQRRAGILPEKMYAIHIRTDLPSKFHALPLSCLFRPEEQVEEQAPGAGQSTTRLTSEYSQGCAGKSPAEFQCYLANDDALHTRNKIRPGLAAGRISCYATCIA